MKMADQTLLIGICSLCTSLAAILFGVEISLHNTWYNWLSTILCLGMFVVPGITYYLRRKGKGCVKVLADTVFVLYGIVTLSITSLSVGLAGDSPWGCGLENLFKCEHHPGMWGAMLFGIASITGHAFGWNRIKYQQTQKGFEKGFEKPLTEQEWSTFDDMNTNPYDTYVERQRKYKKEQYDKQVKWGFLNLMVSLVILLVFTIVALVENRIQLFVLYICALLYQLLKLTIFMEDTHYYGCCGNGNTNIKYGVEKTNLVIVNLILIVWLVGANWHIVGKKIKGEKDLGWPVASACFTTLVAVLQHYII